MRSARAGGGTLPAASRLAQCRHASTCAAGVRRSLVLLVVCCITITGSKQDGAVQPLQVRDVGCEHVVLQVMAQRGVFIP